MVTEAPQAGVQPRQRQRAPPLDRPLYRPTAKAVGGTAAGVGGVTAAMVAASGCPAAQRRRLLPLSDGVEADGDGARQRARNRGTKMGGAQGEGAPHPPPPPLPPSAGFGGRLAAGRGGGGGGAKHLWSTQLRRPRRAERHQLAGSRGGVAPRRRERKEDRGTVGAGRWGGNATASAVRAGACVRPRRSSAPSARAAAPVWGGAGLKNNAGPRSALPTEGGPRGVHSQGSSSWPVGGPHVGYSMTGIAGLGNRSRCAERPNTAVRAIIARGAAWPPACLHAVAARRANQRAARGRCGRALHRRDGPRAIGWIFEPCCRALAGLSPGGLVHRCGRDPRRAVPCG